MADTGQMDGLHIAIILARDKHREACVASRHSPNTANLDAEKLAERELNVLLDRLLMRPAPHT